MKQQINFSLSERTFPRNGTIFGGFPEPLPPPLHPGTKQPLPPEACSRFSRKIL